MFEGLTALLIAAVTRASSDPEAKSETAVFMSKARNLPLHHVALVWMDRDERLRVSGTEACMKPCISCNAWIYVQCHVCHRQGHQLFFNRFRQSSLS